MRVLIRCDASAAIGFGHLMRCIALAQRLKASGDQVSFLIREEPAAVRILRQAGLPAVWLPRRCALNTVLGRLKRLVASSRAAGQSPWVVVDSYEAPQRQSRAALAAGAQVLVVNDAGHAPAHVHAIVNPNLDASRAWYPNANGARLLLGAPYALLRREFHTVRRSASAAAARRVAARSAARGTSSPAGIVPARSLAGTVKRILVTLGGSDAGNRTALVLQGFGLLEERRRRALEIHVVLGFGNGRAVVITRLARQLGLRCRVHRGVDRMAPMLARADMAITAAGGTLFEAARCGVPLAMVTLAKNQQRNAAAFARRGLGLRLGSAATLTPRAVANGITRLLDDAPLRASMRARGCALIDGQGPRRIRQAMAAMERV